jgi:hypothetical protein
MALGRHGRRLQVRDPEVHELGPAVREDEDVPRLDVAMHDPRAVRVVERVRQRGQDSDGLIGRDLPPVAEDDLQRGPLEVLHHEVVLAHVEDADDVRMRELSRGLGLAAEPAQVLLAGLSGEELLLHRLDRDDALHHGVEAAVHAPHRPFADLPLDLVAAEPLGRHSASPPRGRDQHVAGSRHQEVEPRDQPDRRVDRAVGSEELAVPARRRPPSRPCPWRKTAFRGHPGPR